MAGNVIEVSPENWDQEVLNSDKKVVVDFWAAWCGPCRAMAPVIEELAVKHGESVKVVKLNVDEYPDIAAKYEIRSIPTFVLFESGNVKKRVTGSMPLDRLVEEIGL